MRSADKKLTLNDQWWLLHPIAPGNRDVKDWMTQATAEITRLNTIIASREADIVSLLRVKDDLRERLDRAIGARDV